jgi:mono/diheme cytochrome c family protein
MPAVTEVPEHLLRRAKERRAAMTGESTGDAGGDATSSTAVEPAAGASPAIGGAGGGATPAVPAARVEPPYTGPPPSKPRKQRVPVWAGAALAVLPLWAVLYGGAFGERASSEEGPVQAGATVFRAQGCSGCHGPTGGGGVGPALASVTKTFPDFADHVQWVRTGSKPFTGKPYGATGKIASGGMPAFPDLSDEEVIAVVCHERVTFGKADPIPPECEAGAEGGTGEGGDKATEPDAGSGGAGGGGEGDTDSASAGS